MDGDPESQLALRFAAWSLAGSVSSTDPGRPGAKLLSGFGYRHHVFWDTDIFIIPYLTLTRPAAARNHIAYRYRGLPGARRKAAHYEREGLSSPGSRPIPGMRSPRSGVSTTVNRSGSGPARSRAHRCRHRLGDRPLRGLDRRRGCLLDQGAEIILEGARYWAGRLEDEDDGGHLRGVIGPDEYHTKLTTTCSPTPWRRGSCESRPDW